MNKRQSSVLAIYVIVLVLFFLLFFIIPFNRCASAVVMFIFGLLSIALGYGITYMAFKNTTDLKSKVYGFPVFRVGYIYTLGQLTLALAVFIIDFVFELPMWLALAISLIMLGFALIGMIAADNVRDIVEEVDKTLYDDRARTDTFRIDISDIVYACTNAELKKKLEKLSEKLRYSDPVSKPVLAETEGTIREKLNEISEMINKSDLNIISEKIKETEILLEKRNKMCRETKNI